MPDTIKLIQDYCRVLHRTGDDFDPLVEAVGDASLVLIGEASHGTHEFYQARAQITQQLIEEKGFTGVVAEADWPDAYRVNRFVRGEDRDRDADSALAGFLRFPQWMWRNRVVLEFVQWLRLHNHALPAEQTKVGFYGMDLYSLYGSIAAVLEYLDRIDPAAAKRARFRYGCFEQFEEDPQAYGYAASFDLDRSCEDKVIQQLLDLQKHATELAKRDGDDFFVAEQNARLIRNAEEYYRQMFIGRIDTWNLRDTHMTDTIEALRRHLGPKTKLVVWAHNSHLGDARATSMGARGEVNVGSLCRQRWGREVFNIGFSTHAGTVTAAHDWGGDATIMRVNLSMPGSVERLFHDVGLQEFMVIFGDEPRLKEALRDERLERAIGVIYRPNTERISHYFHARVSEQFNAVIHYDVTNALMPLERTAPFESEEAETFPTGM
jgi:erythromycin esterase-like protein